jgi:hypothetical protein
MDTISINHTKENIIEFDLTMEGVETKDVEVKMMVETGTMELGFKAKNKEKDTWMVKLPKLSILERTAYKFYIEIHVDGYYFTPFKGTLNVVGSAEVYSSEPKNVTLKTTNNAKDEPKNAPKGSQEEKKKVSESWRAKEKSIEQIARELVEQQKQEKDVPVKNTPVAESPIQQTLMSNGKDEKVRAILEEAGIRPKPKRTRVSFVKTKTLN